MKRNFVLTFLLFGLFFSAAYTQPIIEIEGKGTLDWKKVKPEDSPLKGKLKIYNRSKEDTLRIYSVKPACGCTTAPLDKEEIEPGGYATLDITLNIGSYTKDVHKTISIRCNDPDSRTKTVHIRCFVVRAISILPKNLYFNSAVTGVESTANVEMHNSTDKDIILKEISIGLEGLVLNIKEGQVIPAKGKIKVKGTFTPKVPGYIRGSIKIKTDHPDASKLEIKAMGRVKEKEAEIK